MHQSKIKQAVSLVATASLIGGCATTGTEFPTIYESARTSAGDVEKTLSVPESIVALRSFVPFAKMSEAVYRRERRTSWEMMRQSCDYVAAVDQKPLNADLPEDWLRLDQKMMVKLGMETATPAEPLRPCRGGAGLEYETYVKFDKPGQPLQATIAFRGTENTKQEWRSDWVANFSNVDFGLGGNIQFKETRKEGLRLIEALSRVLPKTKSSPLCEASSKSESAQVPIELVGHSLGGGLAQHLAYSTNACHVRSTITFDPSPATGWFYLNLRDLVVTKDPIIYRVYIDGEALSFVRKVSTKFNLSRENRRDVRIVFPGVDVGAFGRHSMTLLYEGMLFAANGPPVPNQDLRVDYASTKIYPEVPKSN